MFCVAGPPMVWVPQANPHWPRSIHCPYQWPSPGVGCPDPFTVHHHSPFIVDLPINSMENFHRYVCLPGGNCVYIYYRYGVVWKSSDLLVSHLSHSFGGNPQWSAGQFSGFPKREHSTKCGVGKPWSLQRFVGRLFPGRCWRVFLPEDFGSPA